MITDHKALRYAFQKKDIHVRLSCWLEMLAQYDFDVQYRPWSKNSTADFLTRPFALDKDRADQKNVDVISLVEIDYRFHGDNSKGQSSSLKLFLSRNIAFLFARKLPNDDQS